MNINEYSSLPLGSLVWRSEEEEDHYLKLFVQMPPGVKQMVTADNSGAFIRGLAKSYQAAPNKTSHLAFIILRAAAGELALNQLPGALAAELSLPNERAQRMAQEIEKDLFSPVKEELRQYWAKAKVQKNPALPPLMQGEGQRTPQNPSPFPLTRGEAATTMSLNTAKPSPPGTPRIPPNLLNLKEQPRILPPPPIPPPI